MLFTTLTTVVLASFGSIGVQAASQAICGLHGRYLNTDNNLTPCDIASLLVGNGVKPADSPFPDLEAMGADRYPAPTASEADELRCNPVFYNLVSACGSCQGSTFKWVSYKEWTVNCGSTLTGVGYLTERLPSNVALPSWAFIPPSVGGGSWDNVAAYREYETQSPDSYFSTKSAATASAPLNCKNTGAIAGGVVGGVAALGLIAVLGVFLLRKKTTTGNNMRRDSDVDSVDTIMRAKQAAPASA